MTTDNFYFVPENYCPKSTTSVTITSCSTSERFFEFGGGFNISGKSFAIKEVRYNNPATIVFWDDDTKTVSKCHPEDTYNPETGLAICVLKKLVGSAAIRELMEDWLPAETNKVTLKDVRHKHKNE